MAHQVKTGELDADSRPKVMEYLESLLKTYVAYPDFTWKLAGDLLQIQSDKAAHNKMYERLVNSYEMAGRPHLAIRPVGLGGLSLRTKAMANRRSRPEHHHQQIPRRGPLRPPNDDPFAGSVRQLQGRKDILSHFYINV